MAILKWVGRVVAAFVVLFLLAVGAVYAISYRMLTQRIDVPVLPVADLRHGDVNRGQHLVRAVTDCSGCHGADLAGKLFLNDPALGTIYAPNLTRGAGGIGATFTDADWIRALRYGVRPGGTPLIVMPSRDFAELTNADAAAIVSYVRSVPPVSRTTPPVRVGPLARVLFATHQLPIDAETIRRETPQPSVVQIGVTVDYGRYLARVGGCMACHGVRLSGGHFEGAPSDPPAQDLTRSGDLGHWTFAQFTRTLRTGIRPNGTRLNDFMPWPRVAQMSDRELLAIYKFLQSVPAGETVKG